ncbi:unnamed protein product [Phytophthora fragariaefolia]|uniref:Unnamed protein product n=1 Tax=Phytophthora fragariaefolia TaxID=1490495 RepID=A0A9W6U0J4_9STRA|nr:unnamed protein product [Phytophthora fragariaefolia]
MEKSYRVPTSLKPSFTWIVVQRRYMLLLRKTQVYTERTIRVKLGDNKIGEAILELVTIETQLKNVPNDQCVSVVFDIPEESDCVLGVPGKNVKAETMFTLGVVDSDGVETKYATRKKLRKFLRLSGKDAPEHDFMVVLTNDTIKRIEQDLKRNDEPDNVGSEKANRFLHTDWESFMNNPAYPIIIDYKDNVFKPELPDGLPMQRDIEDRIDVKDPNIALYRRQIRLPPE